MRGVFASSVTGAAPSKAALTLWYETPAREWIEALPVGSGRLGAMVFGGVAEERLSLNEDTLWAGGPYDPNHPEAFSALSEVRRLIFDGQYRQAQELAGARMMAKPLCQMPYQALGDLRLAFAGLETYAQYRRELDLDTAVAETSFTSDGVDNRRVVFASPIDQVVVVRLTSTGAKRISFDLSLVTPHGATIEVEGTDTLVLRGQNGAAHGVDGALRFVARAHVTTSGGSCFGADGRIAVREADSATLLLAMATSYRSFRDVSGNPESTTARQIAESRHKGYDALLSDHIAEHQRLFRRVSIDLGRSSAERRPTDARVRDSQGAEYAELAALYFQYARYLLISSSRPGTQAANLQGLWNESIDPPWGSKYTININTEMNYWLAESTNLAECVEPLIALVKDLAETGARTAKVHYGARGWVAHHNTDLWRAAAPVDGPEWGLWPTGGAWLCLHLWEHFAFSGDRNYLAAIYPLLKGAAEFFLDTLVEEPDHQWLVTCPSLSPENTHRAGAALCAGPAMDQQILRDLFLRCIEAADLLSTDSAFRNDLAGTRARLAPDQIGAAGQLQEWLDDWDHQAPEMHHRHVSHLYGLFPSEQIDVHSTPELARAARKSLDLRGDESTGWGIAWRLNLWARLGEGERAHQMLRMLLGPEHTYPNLFDAHPPFQIDGNFGGASGIAEMLMQSHAGAIHLLPALPKAWTGGAIRGLVARGGFEVDIEWQGGALAAATISSRRRGAPIVRYREHELELQLDAGDRARVLFDGSSLQKSS
ncbi:MAG TPA: glycoside hydrolase family 95 protein [Polyangiaceae bacterium]|nr:glycoside hydrolase family 95 protein [Polyangiaceae bacterium]